MEQGLLMQKTMNSTLKKGSWILNLFMQPISRMKRKLLLCISASTTHGNTDEANNPSLPGG